MELPPTAATIVVVNPLTPRAALAVGVFVLVIAGSWFLARPGRPGFQIDEAHKLSESAFLSLWLRGDVRNPAWFEHIIDRTNPPVGKYLIGSAVLAAGAAVPALPTLSALAPEGGIPAIHPPHLTRRFELLLVPARRAPAVAVAITAALLAFVLARIDGLLAAASAVAFFCSCHLTLDLSRWIVVDSFLAMFVAAAVVGLVVLVQARTTGGTIASAAVVGLASALAFQTRLNGLLALATILPIMLVALRTRRKVAAASVAACLTLFIVTVMAVNPYYWSAPATRIDPFSQHRFPLRPAERVVTQARDLRTLATRLQEGRIEARTIPEKIGYSFATVMLDHASVLMTVLAAVAVIRFGISGRSRRRDARYALAVAFAIAMVMAISLPMPWPRYVFVIVPSLAMLAGLAVGDLVRLTARAFHDARGR